MPTLPLFNPDRQPNAIKPVLAVIIAFMTIHCLLRIAGSYPGPHAILLTATVGDPAEALADDAHQLTLLQSVPEIHAVGAGGVVGRKPENLGFFHGVGLLLEWLFQV